MQLIKALRLMRRIVPEVMRHRGHIGSGTASHDTRTKPISEVKVERIRSRSRPAVPRGAASTIETLAPSIDDKQKFENFLNGDLKSSAIKRKLASRA